MTSVLVAAALVYLVVGVIFAALDGSPDTVFLWPFGLDIRLLYWARALGVRRQHRRELAAFLEERERTLKVCAFEWIDQSEAKVTITHRDEVSVWRGSCTVWHQLPDGGRASTWLEAWLCDRWQSERWKRMEER